MKIFILLLLIWTQMAQGQDESSLLQSCKKADLIACEKLGALYLAKESWSNSYMIGEMLCGKDVVMGCTFAGTSLLNMNKIKEGMSFLNKSCDRFEPHACRSLARLMKSNKETSLSYIYFKRACQYGLDESCRGLTKPKNLYSNAGKDYLKKLKTECADTSMSSCQDHLALLGTCKAPLTQDDCLIIPGELSIYFRGKLKQAEAALSLTSILAAQKLIKEAPQSKGYSYDLGAVLKTFKPLSRYEYVFGFMKACRKKYGEKKWITTSLELFPDSYNHLSRRVKANIIDYFEKGKQDDCYDPKGGYQAFAVGNLDEMSPRRLDVWKSNQDGNLIQLTDGLPEP